MKFHIDRLDVAFYFCLASLALLAAVTCWRILDPAPHTQTWIVVQEDAKHDQP